MFSHSHVAETTGDVLSSIDASRVRNVGLSGERKKKWSGILNFSLASSS